MEWSDEKCLELISFYNKMEILWQAKHLQHYNKQKKQDAWEEIGRRDDIYESSWFAFKAMLFMQDKDEPRKRLNTLQENDSYETLEEREAPPVVVVDSPLTPEYQSQTPPSSRPKAPRKNKKRVNEERMDKAFSILETMHSGRQDETEHDIFGKLVASKLKRYSPHVSSTVQEELMKVLFKADRGLYNIHTPSQPSTHTPSHQLSTDSSETHSSQQLFPTECPSPSFSQYNHES
ncbi:uncharacterized protein LOC143220087 [Lasioglossum baleicum]|uniref:uncharacterized protein LOC143220087 n=1 Tax=Lasioglossum baleicum TaxID=434251 RepID=UPI003FCD26B9